MAVTNGEFVSRVINDINAIQKDTRVSKRWILGIGKQKAETYISQKWDEGMLFGEESLYTNIACLRMERLRSIDCCFDEFKICGTLMRSKDRIPGLVHARMKPSVLTVTSVDDGINFDYVSLRKYKNDAKRSFSKIPQYYFYVSDGYIYIPDIHIEAINVTLITTEKNEALKLSGCGHDDSKYECMSIWDEQFVCPQKLYEYVVKETIKEASIRLSVPSDENPNMDSNERTTTIS